MRVLAIDTATEICGLALCNEGGIIEAQTFRQQREVSRQWAVRLRSILERTGLSLSQIEGFVVNIGPGSFTGVRVGVTAAKVFAHSLSKPLLGLNTLELLVLPFRGLVFSSLCPIVFCRRGEIYTALYRFDDQELRVLKDPRSLPIDQFPAFLGEESETLLCGEIAWVKNLPFKSSVRWAEPRYHFPDITVLALEGRRRLLMGQRDEPNLLIPFYLKLSQAEERFASSVG